MPEFIELHYRKTSRPFLVRPDRMTIIRGADEEPGSYIWLGEDPDAAHVRETYAEVKAMLMGAQLNGPHDYQTTEVKAEKGTHVCSHQSWDYRTKNKDYICNDCLMIANGHPGSIDTVWKSVSEP